METEEFKEALMSFVRNPSGPRIENLKVFGVQVFGLRHHDDLYEVKYGHALHKKVL
jgi:hypothetical protein